MVCFPVFAGCPLSGQIPSSKSSVRGAGRAQLSRVEHRNRPSRVFGRDKFSGARQSFEATKSRTRKDRGRQNLEKPHHLFCLWPRHWWCERTESECAAKKESGSLEKPTSWFRTTHRLPPGQCAVCTHPWPHLRLANILS